MLMLIKKFKFIIGLAGLVSLALVLYHAYNSIRDAALAESKTHYESIIKDMNSNFDAQIAKIQNEKQEAEKAALVKELQIKTAYTKALILERGRKAELEGEKRKIKTELERLANENQNWADTSVPLPVHNWLQHNGREDMQADGNN